jgi:hypothetical protein
VRYQRDKQLDCFLEEVEKDIDEAVVDPRLRAKMGTPSQRKQVGLGVAAKVDAAKEKLSAAEKRQLHVDRELSTKQRDAIKNVESTGAIKEFHYGNRDDMYDDFYNGLDGEMGITPDHLYQASREDGDFQVTMIYFPATDEMFFRESGNVDLEKGKRNYGLGEEYNYTHDRMLEMIIRVAERSPDILEEDEEWYGSWFDQIGEIEPEMVLGRWYEGILSFWNGLDDGTAKKLGARLKQYNTDVDEIKEIWVSDQTHYSR